MRRTKIVCTIGPASDDKETLTELIDAGMNVARLNFSHGDHAEQKAKLERIREITNNNEGDRKAAILLDTKGPEIRTGKLETDEKVYLEKGQEFIVTTEDIAGNSDKVSISYKGICDDLETGDTILVDDGLIGLEVKEIQDPEITCEVINGGKLGSTKGVNLPGVPVRLPAITEKDVNDIKFGIENEVDFIAASFIRKADDVLSIREILEEHDADINIIAKIENQEGVENVDEILEVADGLMVARGDLGVEIPPEEVPAAQKMMIKKCNRAGKPVITATQMLDSMIENPRPTRAEASDVANAIYDGTDATMLSGETAMGDYPVASVDTMNRIARETEKALQYEQLIDRPDLTPAKTITNSICHDTCKTAYELDASAIITSTRSGYTARMVSKYRPYAPIIAVTPNKKVFNKLILSWGVKPVLADITQNTDEMIDKSVEATKEAGYIENGDLAVITAGAPGVPSTTNLLKVEIVGEAALRGVGVGNKAASGKICVAENADDAIENIEDGDILVAPETTKAYAPALEKAVALITEEPGVTSHAATKGMELDIPVIVGVSGAVRDLSTGDTVTVDSIRGLIYKGEAKVL
ncbi:pyruvate kinase [Halanaerobacter jeridensis]|uniref:Pyruvate kinase n=1 Tax=Halanaerobacter jeridensis TaxID=706427 RepID=A0A938XQC0_9FIRM|nr:pyruvate kinase [Halanaerobacter jeridensis]MBM7555629.1 pyruvate kinase [Halanaerobacter jeridensis]